MLSFKDKLLIRTLLIVAKIVAEDGWRKEIDSLAAHIQYAKPDGVA